VHSRTYQATSMTNFWVVAKQTLGSRKTNKSAGWGSGTRWAW